MYELFRLAVRPVREGRRVIERTAIAIMMPSHSHEKCKYSCRRNQMQWRLNHKGFVE